MPNAAQQCQEKGIPLLKDLEYGGRTPKMVGFKYKVALARRPARDNKLEPFFYSRDVGHTTKAGSRALCSSAFTLVLGETSVCHHHTLDKGIDPR